MSNSTNGLNFYCTGMFPKTNTVHPFEIMPLPPISPSHEPFVSRIEPIEREYVSHCPACLHINPDGPSPLMPPAA